MGQPVIHFEVTGKDGDNLVRYYSELFEWEIDANNHLGYGIVEREGNTNSEGVGIGVASPRRPTDPRDSSRSTSRCPTSR